MTKLAPTAVRIHLKALMDEGLVTKDSKGLYPSFKANRDNVYYKLLKSQNLILRLYSSGLLAALETLYPTCIVLFGSASRGEDTEMSDIDLFVQAKQSKVDTDKYEKALNRKTNLLFEPDVRKLSAELANNLANGIVVYGYLKVL